MSYYVIHTAIRTHAYTHTNSLPPVTVQVGTRALQVPSLLQVMVLSPTRVKFPVQPKVT